MDVISVYKKYRIPKSLQEHMLLVAALGKYILEAKGIKLDFVIKALLLHDIGNLIKFELGKGLNLFYDNERDYVYWKKVQDEMIREYGEDEHLATLKIVSQITKSRIVIDMIETIDSNDFTSLISSNNYIKKVAVYCDFRATNRGYVSVDERFEDIISRYSNRKGFMGLEAVFKKRNYCRIIEKQIETYYKINLTNLQLDRLDVIREALFSFEI